MRGAAVRAGGLALEGAAARLARGVATRARVVVCGAMAVLGLIAFAPAAVLAADAADGPSGAVALGTVTAENGAVGDLSAVLDPAGAAADEGVPRCLGGASFERTVWAWVPAAEGAGRVTVEVTPQSGSTAQPDLAVFVQPPGGTRELPDAREPSACDGRELLSDGARGDASSAGSVVVGPGRPLLVQVGLRGGDADVPLVVSAHRDPLTLAAAPAGDEPQTAPAVALGAAFALSTGGATLGAADPAEPWCQAPATVWRRVVLPRAGYYVVAAAGDAATLTVFADPLTADSALGCADAGDGDGTTVAVRAPAGPLWVRVGTDHPEAGGAASLASAGPFADQAAASAALATVGAKAQSVATCTSASAPRVTLSATALAGLRARRTRVLTGTVRQPCDAKRARAKAVRVGLARRRAGKCVWLGARRAARCATVAGARTASGVLRWRATLPKRLAPGTFRLVVQLRVAKPGAKRLTTTTALTKTIIIKKKKATT